MKLLPTTAALLIATAPAALVAQTDPHQPDNNGSAAASASVPPGDVAPGYDPGTAAANAGVRGDIAATHAINGASQAQYAADLATYDVALAKHGQQSARYARQRRAYADAMAAWRVQADACRRGRRAACNAPAPDPASFY